MVKALVFGCTGQDGSLLCRSLLHQGIKVIGVSRSSNPNLTIHQSLGIDGEVLVITGAASAADDELTIPFVDAVPLA